LTGILLDQFKDVHDHKISQVISCSGRVYVELVALSSSLVADILESMLSSQIEAMYGAFLIIFEGI